MLPNSVTQPMSDDYTDSVQQARADCIRQRLELGLNPDPDAPVNLVVKPMGSVVPFLRGQDDASFTAPANVHQRQAEESLRVLKLAQTVAELAYNRELAELPRKQQATCRYLACHALRMTSVNWQHAALNAAMNACKTWMLTEGGKRFRGISENHLELVAVMLVPAILTAYRGVSEGSQAMTPGRYRAIEEGRGL